MKETRNEIADVLMGAAEVAFSEEGLVLVPRELNQMMFEALDDSGERIWDGGTEHYFRSREEALWYARQVWAAMIRAASNSD